MMVGVTINCRVCHQPQQIMVSDKQLIELVRRPRAKFVQDILPDHAPAVREMFVSEICGPCFDKLWAPEESHG